MKKLSGDVMILHMFSKNHNHMMYASWDMEYDRHNFLSFWAIFSLFTPLLTPKIKIRNKCKKSLEILSYYTSTINEDHMMYGSWDKRHDKQSFLSFLAIFCPLNLLKPENSKFWKNLKKKILSFYTCIPQMMII